MVFPKVAQHFFGVLRDVSCFGSQMRLKFQLFFQHRVTFPEIIKFGADSLETMDTVDRKAGIVVRWKGLGYIGRCPYGCDSSHDYYRTNGLLLQERNNNNQNLHPVNYELINWLFLGGFVRKFPFLS